MCCSGNWVALIDFMSTSFAAPSSWYGAGLVGGMNGLGGRGLMCCSGNWVVLIDFMITSLAAPLSRYGAGLVGGMKGFETVLTPYDMNIVWLVELGVVSKIIVPSTFLYGAGFFGGKMGLRTVFEVILWGGRRSWLVDLGV